MINFDLHTDVLIQVFGLSNYTKGYTEVEKYLLKNGFEHSQFSGYTSEKPMSYPQAYAICRSMNRQLKWLSQAVNKFSISNLSSDYNFDELFQDNNVNCDLELTPTYDDYEDEYTRGR